MVHSAARGVLVGLAVVSSCSGGGNDADRALDPLRLAEALESSPCGGGELRAMPTRELSLMRQGFERWPLPPVYVSARELGGDAVACFDGKAVIVHQHQAADRVIVAHEFCHAVAYLFDRTAPLGFPSPEPVTARAQALEPEVWHQEIWAVTCSTAVTGDEDWSWGHLIHDSTAEALTWARNFIADGPRHATEAPSHWTTPQVSVLVEP